EVRPGRGEDCGVRWRVLVVVESRAGASGGQDAVGDRDGGVLVGGDGPEVHGGRIQRPAQRVVGDSAGAGLDGVAGDGDVGQGDGAVQVEHAAPVRASLLGGEG